MVFTGNGMEKTVKEKHENESNINENTEKSTEDEKPPTYPSLYTVPEYNGNSGIYRKLDEKEIEREEIERKREERESRIINNKNNDLSNSNNETELKTNNDSAKNIYKNDATNGETNSNNIQNNLEKQHNETHKNTKTNETKSNPEIKLTSDILKTSTEVKNNNEDKRGNYEQNITLSSSGTGLVLYEKEGKDELLPESTTVVRFAPIWKQSLASSASILLTFTAGLTSGYSAILLPQLKQPDSVIRLDDSTASWIAAMAALPMAPGCLISGWMMEKFGRKTSHYLVAAPFLLGWILIACAKDISLMLLGRFFTGLCVGLLGPLGPVYIGETTDPKYRGFFLAGVSLAIAIGILVAHIIGTFISWQCTAIICCAFPILSVGLLMLVPESPTWLISKGHTEDGVKSFYWLRGYDEHAKIELKGLIDKQKAVDSEPKMSWKEKLISLKSPELLKPLFIMIFFFITCQFSGVNAVAFYSIDIVEKAVGKGMNHYVVMLIIDSIRVIMSVIACVICKMYGRRPLCFISGILTALSMVGLSMYLYLSAGKQGISWVPLVCLAMYIIAISVGFVPLPWIMCGEVFPTRVRGLGSGISAATTFVSFFIVVKTAPDMMKYLGEISTFLIYGIVALVGTIVLYFILPETKGKSLQEIEERFKSGKGKTSVHIA